MAQQTDDCGFQTGELNEYATDDYPDDAVLGCTDCDTVGGIVHTFHEVVTEEFDDVEWHCNNCGAGGVSRIRPTEWE